MRNLLRILPVCTLLALSACSADLAENRGFSLPEGDMENGQLIFAEMQCISCHTLAGTEIDESELAAGREMAVELGGESTRAQTYADLVTSIINPSHRIARGYNRDSLLLEGESRMPSYNEVLRVSELIDLVTFLKSKYQLKSVPLTTYPFYIYPG